MSPYDAQYTYESWKVDKGNQGKAVVSDALYGFEPYNWAYLGMSAARGAYIPPAADPALIDLGSSSMWWSRHDSAYNVLFTDGSVKTFSDAGQSLRKTTVELGRRQYYGGAWARQHGLTMGQKNKYLVSIYFDPLYAQD